MKKMLLTAVLAGGALFAANAGDFDLGLPGFSLKIGDGPCYRRVYAPTCGTTVVYRCGNPAYFMPPPPRHGFRKMPPPPPPRHHR